MLDDVFCLLFLHVQWVSDWELWLTGDVCCMQLNAGRQQCDTPYWPDDAAAWPTTKVALIICQCVPHQLRASAPGRCIFSVARFISVADASRRAFVPLKEIREKYFSRKYHVTWRYNRETLQFGRCSASACWFPQFGGSGALYHGGIHWWCQTGRQWVATGRLGRLKLQDRKMQDWKMTDKNYRGRKWRTQY